MLDFFEIDFLKIETSQSGGAICIRYSIDDLMQIHVIDGGFQDTGDDVVEHINTYYGNPRKIDHVVATHEHRDHTGGLKKVLEEFEVGTLWMNRPWAYSKQLIDRFRYENVDNLTKKLKEVYSNLEELEQIAQEKNITIKSAFQGTEIGKFVVLAPTMARFLQLVVDSKETPKPVTGSKLVKIAKATKKTLIAAIWGSENLLGGSTDAENEMSIVQIGKLCGKQILLTGDAGTDGLNEAFNFAKSIPNIKLPGVNFLQSPHHGSRHNLSSEVLDKLVGSKFSCNEERSFRFTAYIDASKKDESHPHNAVVRALYHRGGDVFTSEDNSIRHKSKNAPDRDWGASTPLPYPEEQEE